MAFNAFKEIIISPRIYIIQQQAVHYPTVRMPLLPKTVTIKKIKEKWQLQTLTSKARE